MKGIELPINILVIVAVAVIVLLGLVALYFSGVMGPMGVMEQQSAKQEYCSQIMNNPAGCRGELPTRTIVINDFDANKDGNLRGGTDWYVDSEGAWETLPIEACTSEDEETGDNLASLLACYFGARSERSALQICGCTI
ncbi:MAG: hypothetical protein CW691_06975 [Candidatus Bathyarchaeum sp.]|nr:MAG: hypothetical protein CW691_06975 [Candidatus Bathyarchaeum sp.]